MPTVLVGDIYVKGRSSTKVQISSSTGRSYNEGNRVNTAEDGSTGTNLANHGVSLLTYSTAANLFTLDAPVAGRKKEIVLNSTVAPDATAIAFSVYSGSADIFIRDNSTTFTKPLYVNMLPPYASVSLIGLSTSEWGVLSSFGAVDFSTAAGYTT